MSQPERFRIVDGASSAGSHDRNEARDRLLQQKLPETLRDFRKAAETFQLTPALETAINTALAVGAPLLITGEPGTGKTQVAWYLGWYFGIETFEYQVRSTSTADDLKFDFDAVAYLRTAQEQSGKAVDRSDPEFLKPKALWQAYTSKEPCVLLIDEIDKAPRDFPNDLLLELDKHAFRHPHRDEIVRPRAIRPPIVVITSNAERRLPDAFLRRCIFHHLALDRQLVQRAVQARVGDFPHLDDATKEAALEAFWRIREREAVQKKPATGELLVWLAILSARKTTKTDLDRDLRDLPALGALVKDHQDLAGLKS